MWLDFSIFFAYTDCMSRVYISELASPELIEYLLSEGHEVKRVEPADNVDSAISCHPDILFCHLRDGVVFYGNPGLLGNKYPADVLYNACSTGKYFIHNLKHTSPELLAAADELGLIKVHVPQGYARCSALPVDEDSIITYDRGIAASCSDMDVLLINPGHIILPGYSAGFIGGTGGRIGNTIVFNGNLSAHPDFEIIKDFIESRGLECVWTTDIPLTDIGSIIEEY